MSLGPIPWTSIVSYAAWYGLEEDVAEAFVDIIREMDTAYLKHIEQKAAANKESKKRDSKRRSSVRRNSRNG